MTNNRDLPPDPENDDPRQATTSDCAPPSTLLVSPLSLARELAEVLKQRHARHGESWRLACALSLNLVDVLEQTRATEADGETGAEHPTTWIDPISR